MSRNVFSVRDGKTWLNDRPFLAIGLRLSNALVNDEASDSLIANLDLYKGYGVNSFSVFLQGSRFGDVKGYREDASLDPTYAARLGRIIDAADERAMIAGRLPLLGQLARQVGELDAARGQPGRRQHAALAQGARLSQRLCGRGQ